MMHIIILILICNILLNLDMIRFNICKIKLLTDQILRCDLKNID